MEPLKIRYHVRVPLEGATAEGLANGIGYRTICRADTPAGAGEVVSILLTHGEQDFDHLRIEIHREA